MGKFTLDKGTQGTLLVVLFCELLFCQRLLAQMEPSGSIISIESERYRALGITSERGWDSLNNRQGSMPTSVRVQPSSSPRSDTTCLLNRIVYGWNPYWAGTAYNDYDYSLLSDICYFSYEVNPATGSYTTIHSWSTTNLLQKAKAAGVRIHLCVTLFSGHATFFGNPTSQKTLIDSLIALVRLRDGDGVNIDFEAVPASQRSAMTAFMIELARRFHQEISGSQVSLALPAVDWGNTFDVAAMAPHVDLFIIMGYDYHWGGSEQAGPVAPKNSGTIWAPYNLTRSINSYLQRGIPHGKLCLGLPYYGREWATADSTLPSSTIGTGSAVLYSTARVNALLHERKWDLHSSTPYYTYYADSSWRQCFYDDEESLRLKYDLVKMKELAGIGIWALSYDAPYGELWDLIESSFTDCAASLCIGTITDMGGPAGNYYSNDSFLYTIAPASAKEVSLSFFSFSVANDTLAIYDGNDTSAPLIGKYTSTISPGVVTAKSGAMTLKFISDSTAVSWGWNATWNCVAATQGIDPEVAPAPIQLTARPNPFSGSTTIEYSLLHSSPVVIVVSDLAGRKSITLLHEVQKKGKHQIEFSRARLGLPPGTYLVQLTAGTVTSSILLAGG